MYTTNYTIYYSFINIFDLRNNVVAIGIGLKHCQRHSILQNISITVKDTQR